VVFTPARRRSRANVSVRCAKFVAVVMATS